MKKVILFLFGFLFSCSSIHYGHPIVPLPDDLKVYANQILKANVRYEKVFKTNDSSNYDFEIASYYISQYDSTNGTFKALENTENCTCPLVGSALKFTCINNLPNSTKDQNIFYEYDYSSLKKIYEANGEVWCFDRKENLLAYVVSDTGIPESKKTEMEKQPKRSYQLIVADLKTGTEYLINTGTLEVDPISTIAISNSESEIYFSARVPSKNEYHDFMLLPLGWKARTLKNVICRVKKIGTSWALPEILFDGCNPSIRQDDKKLAYSGVQDDELIVIDLESNKKQIFDVSGIREKFWFANSNYLLINRTYWPWTHRLQEAAIVDISSGKFYFFLEENVAGIIQTE